LILGAETDPAAPGGAVTTALCGHWEHSGTCRWPHNNAIVATANPALFRTLFVAPAADEEEVRQRIERALEKAEGLSVVSCGARSVAPDEQPLARRLAASGPKHRDS
jgi:hypothetical protein